MVRIQDSQSWHRGSIPLSTTQRTDFSVIEGSVFWCSMPGMGLVFFTISDVHIFPYTTAAMNLRDSATARMRLEPLQPQG